MKETQVCTHYSGVLSFLASVKLLNWPESGYSIGPKIRTSSNNEKYTLCTIYNVANIPLHLANYETWPWKEATALDQGENIFIVLHPNIKLVEVGREVGWTVEDLKKFNGIEAYNHQPSQAFRVDPSLVTLSSHEQNRHHLPHYTSSKIHLLKILFNQTHNYVLPRIKNEFNQTKHCYSLKLILFSTRSFFKKTPN